MNKYKVIKKGCEIVSSFKTNSGKKIVFKTKEPQTYFKKNKILSCSNCWVNIGTEDKLMTLHVYCEETKKYKCALCGTKQNE